MTCVRSGVGLTILSATGYGFMSIFTKYAYEGGISVPTLLFLRFGIAALVLFAWLIITRQSVKVTKHQTLSLAALGVGYTMQATCFFSALRYLSPSLVALLLYTYPIFVIGLARVVEGERVRGKGLAGVALALAGLSFVLTPSLGKVSSVGIALGLGTAIVYSGYITLGNRLVRELPSVLTSAWVALFATVSFFIIGMTSSSLSFDFAISAWPPILAISLVSTVVAMFAFFRGMEIIGSTGASVLSMVEPLVTIVASALLFGDRLTIVQLVGGAAVLVGACVTVLSRTSRGSEASTTELVA